MKKHGNINTHAFCESAIYILNSQFEIETDLRHFGQTLYVEVGTNFRMNKTNPTRKM